MDISFIESDWHIDKIEWACLDGERPRTAGCNARKGVHGKKVQLPLVRITSGGRTGFGWSSITRDQARLIAGKSIHEVLTADGGIRHAYDAIEFPLLDWLGNVTGKPVCSLVSKSQTAEPPHIFSVPCYDTSLYFDDLDIIDDKAAVELIKSEALEGWDRGHRAFKIKVGRGARYMPLIEGTKRDIAIIRGVREIAGPDAKLMIDANNGYNLNLAKEVLLETSGEKLYWIEEAFHEDPILYEELKSWMDKQGLKVLIADGEGVAAPLIIEWAKKGLVDIIQYDLRHYGFNRWLELGSILDSAGVKSAPHNYGGSYGNYAACHLVAAIENLAPVEWDEAKVPGLDDSAYMIAEGMVRVGCQPGFGLRLDDKWFSKAVENSGWSLTAL